MRQIEKIIQKLRDALAEPGDALALQLLATQYAQLCAEANRRLGQCAEMIGRGNRYQTLQLAETRPSLLDLVSLLSFDRQNDWRELCKQRNLPTPERLDEKGVRLLNELYATGMPPTEEMWKAFRAAIADGDDLRALALARTIRHGDQADADAAREVPRLEKKIVREKLRALHESTKRDDGRDVVRLMEEIESVGADGVRETEEWSRGAEVRRRFFARQAARDCTALLARAQTEMERGAWASVLGLLAQVQGRRSDHALELPESEARTFTEAHAWATEREAEHDRDQRWQQALAALEMQVQVVLDKELGQRRRVLPELREDRTLLTRRWHELEEFRREVPAETVTRTRRALAAIKGHIDRAERFRKITLATAALVLLALTIAAGVFSVRSWKAHEFARELSAAMAAGQAVPVAKSLESLRANHASLLGLPTLSARLSEADAWVAERRRRAVQAEQAVAQLREAHGTSGFAQTPPEVIQQKLAQLRASLGAVPEDLRGPAEHGLLELENRFDEFLATERSRQHAHFRGVLEKAEAQALDNLDFTRPPAEVLATLRAIEPALVELDRLSTPPVVRLKPTDSDLAKLELLKSRLAKFQHAAEKLTSTEQAVAGAATLEAYLQALEGYTQTAFLQSVELRGAKAVLENLKDADSVAAALLLPGNAAAWAFFKAHRARRALHPDDVADAEKPAFLALRDDDNLREIYRYEFTDPRNNTGSPIIYTQERLARSEATVGAADHKAVTLTGRVYRPWLSKTTVAFVSETFRADFIGQARNAPFPEKEQLTPESQLFARLALPSLVDDVVATYRRPVLGFLDTVVEAPADALFKGHLFLRLLDLADRRPLEWGLHWTSARADARRLREAVTSAIGSGDWMAPARQTAFGRAAGEFFSKLRGVSYQRQAAVNSQLVDRVFTAGIRYAGFARPDGAPHLVGEGLDATELWGLAADAKKPALLYRKAGSEWQRAAEPLALTPLFHCQLDRAAVLAEICQAAGTTASHPSIAPGLPPFFAVGK